MAVLLGSLTLSGLGGCTTAAPSPEVPAEEPADGGRTTKLTDPDAPKEIELKDILSYDASFYLVTRTTFDDGNELTIWWSRY